MPKTDKELTAEIVCAFLNSCETTPAKLGPMKREDLQNLITVTYTTMRSLEGCSKCEE